MRTKKKYFMPQWAIQKIETLALFYETTKTQALLMMITKGSNYYEKEMKKAGFLKDNTTEKPANNVADSDQSTKNILTPIDKARLERAMEIAKTRIPYDELNTREDNNKSKDTTKNAF